MQRSCKLVPSPSLNRRQQPIGARSHVQRLHGQPYRLKLDRMDARRHASSSRNHWAHWLAAPTGQVMVTAVPLRRS